MNGSWRKAATRRIKRHWRYLLVVVAVYAGALALGETLTALRANFQNVVFDQYQRWRPRAPGADRLVHVVDIDDESIRRLGQWPWPRAKMARLVDSVANAKAAAIGFDVLFSETERAPSDALPEGPVNGVDANIASRSESDAAFAQALADRSVVLSELVTQSDIAGAVPAKSGFTTIGEDPTPDLPHLNGVLGPLPVLANSAAGIGFVNWQADADRVVRRVPLLIVVNGRVQPSFAIECLRVAQGASTYLIKSADAGGPSLGQGAGVAAIKVGDLVVSTEPAGDIRAYFAATDRSLSLPAWKLFEPGVDLSGLAGKIVVIGVSAALLSDVVATPLNPSTPGVEAQAQLIEQILDGDTLLRPDWAPGAEVAAATLLSLALVVATPLLSALWSAALGALAVAAMAGGSWLAFTHYGWLLDPVTPGASSGAVFLAGVLALYSQKRRQLNETRSHFGRFVSPAVVARLAEHPDAVRLGGEQRTLTLMFCDIRSFTTLSEGLSAVELTSFLNEYLTPMTEAVLQEMGTVDKYMGDAIMAFWNAPLDDSDHAAHAVRAALAMRKTLAELNRRWASRAAESGHAFHEVKFGVGLNTGECCVGNLGSTRRFDYSAIGDEVNIASRLEGASKVLGVDIVASDLTRDDAPDFAWLEVDRVLLKGKTRPTPVYALAGDAATAASEPFRELARRHEAILAAYRARDFEAAMRSAAEAAKLAPKEIQGVYASYYSERFAFLAKSELGPSWEPVFRLETK
jgi:adenylate cyclase